MKPRVSIIMNGWNSEKYLKEAMDSALVQTFTNWELIFWDNCSSDSSESIVRSYNDSRIHFYRSERVMPLGEGRHHAILKAKGEWIAFLDADDRWLPEKLEQQLWLDDSPNVGLIYGRCRNFNEEGFLGESPHRYEGKTLPQGDLYSKLLLEGNLISLVSAMVRLSAYHKVGGIPIHLTFAEEYYLFVEVSKHYTVSVLQSTCCEYRLHEGSHTSNHKLDSHLESLDLLRAHQKELPEKPFKKREQVYESLIGIELILNKKGLLQGLQKILFKGSILFVIRGGLTAIKRRYITKQKVLS